MCVFAAAFCFFPFFAQRDRKCCCLTQLASITQMQTGVSASDHFYSGQVMLCMRRAKRAGARAMRRRPTHTEEWWWCPRGSLRNTRSSLYNAVACVVCAAAATLRTPSNRVCIVCAANSETSHLSAIRHGHAQDARVVSSTPALRDDTRPLIGRAELRSTSSQDAYLCPARARQVQSAARFNQRAAWAGGGLSAGAVWPARARRRNAAGAGRSAEPPPPPPPPNQSLPAPPR